MKTRMHRFWLSITLAAGSLASPLCGRLSAHDLPWRWASDTVSSSDWNYLKDDCLDSRSLSRYGDALSRSLEGSLSSCPTEEDVANRFDTALAHQSAARFASEMACWANKWEQMQKKAGEVARARLVSHRQEVLSQWAARPEFGAPPEPAALIVDTCSFEAEYRAMQAAADLLDVEMARAAELSARESRMKQALADAAAIEAATIDTIAQSDLQAASASPAVAASASAAPTSAAFASAAERSFCGGEINEIVSQQRRHSDFALPIDDAMAYDLDGREAHWLGGLGKSWRLRAAISASAAAKADLAADDASAAEGFGADELLENDSAATSALAQACEIIEAPSEDEFALCDFVGPIAPSYQPSAESSIAADLLAAKPDAGIAPAPKGAESALKDGLAEGLQWLDHATCIVAAAMCGMDEAHHLGEQWGDWSLAAAQRSMTSYVAMGHYLNSPPMVVVPTPDLEPKSDVYVVYTDAQGNDTAVPSTLAAAWNAEPSLVAQSDVDLDDASYLLDDLTAFEFNGAVAAGSEPTAPRTVPSIAESAAQWTPQASSLSDAQGAGSAGSLGFAQLRRHVLSLAARELDAIGMSCLQTADQLSNWADPQIASREDNDVR